MFEKISVENIRKIKSGDILIKYPAFGQPVDEVDVKDTNNHVVVRVRETFGNTLGLLLEGSRIPIGIPGLNASVGPLHKERHHLVAEQTWWFYKPEISN